MRNQLLSGSGRVFLLRFDDFSQLRNRFRLDFDRVGLSGYQFANLYNGFSLAIRAALHMFDELDVLR
ncbi:MAG: hypothetical protein KDD44_02755, partial [Bdellovibrionales bacterium]|nr:hypothetical protein [Bdellovibrionales bacterium]